MNIRLTGGGGYHFPHGLKVCFGCYSVHFCVLQGLQSELLRLQEHSHQVLLR